MNPKCSLPAELRRDALRQFDGALTVEEETRIRRMFPQYLFFRNEFRDDGWNVSSEPVRLCTCTGCGQSFEAVRGNYSRGKLHHERCNCPECGEDVEGIAVMKYKYDMQSLERWVKVALARPGKDGALLVEAGNARRTFSHDNLTGEIDWVPFKRYYFGRDGICEWKMERHWDGVFNVSYEWAETKTVGDPFQPNMMGWADYDGRYSVVGLGEALPETVLKYCQVLEFFERRACADLDGGNTARGVLKYLAWACVHPQLEMAVKLGLEGAVEELITEGKKNSKLLNWKAKRPAAFLRMSGQELRLFREQELDYSDLLMWRGLREKLPLADYCEIADAIGGRGNMKDLMRCAEKAGTTAKAAARYVEKLQPVCTRYQVDMKRIIDTWADYLSMAEQLEYDLTDQTVSMPKNLRERHDAAADTITARKNEAELKQYRKRRRQLEKKYAFSLGGYCIKIPTGSEEIVREGKTLKHCVGGYAARHISGKTTILFLRHRKKPGRPFMTIEVDENCGRVRIRQIHGYQNERYGPAAEPEKRFAWFLGPWLQWVNAGSERDREGFPVLPDEIKEKTEARTA